MEFKSFYLESEEEDNIKSMIAKLPKKHAKLLHGFKFKFQSGNTLSGDKNNVGEIHKNKITVCSPWNYARSLVIAHEIAHLCWENSISSEQKKEWSSLLKKTKPEQIKKLKKLGKSVDALNQDDEEIFCMVFGSFYAKHPPITFHNQEWMDFIKKL